MEYMYMIVKHNNKYNLLTFYPNLQKIKMYKVSDLHYS
jgi:hypothetical protein